MRESLSYNLKMDDIGVTRMKSVKRGKSEVVLICNSLI
jgi:hypothetical protein